jgi:hypothetical protein
LCRYTEGVAQAQQLILEVIENGRADFTFLAFWLCALFASAALSLTRLMQLTLSV